MAADMAQLVAGVRKAVAATRSMDQALRVKSETQFKDMSLRNYPRLVYALGEIMRDRTTPLDDPDRQQASILMQGIIKPRDPNMRPVYSKLWTDQSDSFKVRRNNHHHSAFSGVHRAFVRGHEGQEGVLCGVGRTRGRFALVVIVVVDVFVFTLASC
jgi:hypothetical protein